MASTMKPTLRLSLKTFLSAYTVVVFIGSITCWKIVGVRIPPVADMRQPAVLGCSYEEGDEGIFSVKWYKDDDEFFRYIPSFSSDLLTFPIKGAKVNLTSERTQCHKSPCTVVLQDLTPAASGIYTCEVSMEAPSFSSALGYGNMTVAALPLEDPELIGFRGVYAAGDLLNVTCKTSPSLPAAKISMFINDEEVSESRLSRDVAGDATSFYSTSARLQLNLTRSHFEEALALKLRCAASLEAVPLPERVTVATAWLGDNQTLTNQVLEWQEYNATDRVGIPRISQLVSNAVFAASLVALMRRLTLNPS